MQAADFAPDASGGGTDTSVNEKTEDYNAAGEEDFPQPIISISSTSSPMVEIPVAGGVDDSVKGGTMSGLMRWGVQKKVLGRHKKSNITNQEPTTIVDGKEPAVDGKSTRKRKEMEKTQLGQQLVETSVSLNQMQKELGKITSTPVVEDQRKERVMNWYESAEGSMSLDILKEDMRIKERSGRPPTYYSGHGSSYAHFVGGGGYPPYGGAGSSTYPTYAIPQVPNMNPPTLVSSAPVYYPSILPGDPYWTIILQFGKALLSFRGANIYEIRSKPNRFSVHNLCGNDMGNYGNSQGFDSTFGNNQPIIYQLLENWASMEINPYSRLDANRLQNHCIPFWSAGYTKHFREIGLDQAPYFSKGLDFFRRLDDTIHEAMTFNLLHTPPLSHRGVLQLDGFGFTNHIEQSTAPVFIRVSQKTNDSYMVPFTTRPVQEIRELKFYLDYANEDFSWPPPNVLNSYSDYITTNVRTGTSNYDPNLPLYVTN